MVGRATWFDRHVSACDLHQGTPTHGMRPSQAETHRSNKIVLPTTSAAGVFLDILKPVLKSVWALIAWLDLQNIDPRFICNVHTQSPRINLASLSSTGCWNISVRFFFSSAANICLAITFGESRLTRGRCGSNFTTLGKSNEAWEDKKTLGL